MIFAALLNVAGALSPSALQEAEPAALEKAQELLTSLSWIDAVGLGLIALFLVLGFIRGLWRQIIRLVGLVGAVLLARYLSQRWEPALLEQFPELHPRYAQGILWIGLFLLGLAASVLLGLLGKKMLEALHLSLVDRTTGAVLGAATGLLLHCVILAALVQVGTEPFVKETLVGSYSEELLSVVGQQFPVVVNAQEGTEINQLLRWDQP